MTSRVSFYKVMLQDFRHRIWMIALSCLGSFLAMPVFYLLISQDWTDRIERWSVESGWSVAEYKMEQIVEFFSGYMVITGGIILCAGAVIVGLFGFRHVFSKKMIDQYHSIPITRRNLFLANYINGFLIWFVPMLTGAVICAVMAGVFLGDFNAWMIALGYWIKTLGHFVLAFLLIYHTVIIAVMISGNILNTLITGLILGLGIIALYCLQYAFAGQYFNTFYNFMQDDFYKVIWASPFASAVYQLTFSTGETVRMLTIIMNVIMAICMWFAGLFLYLRRPSELAEQGIKIKAARILFKTLTVLMAGMCGWIFFELLNGQLGWMIFGGILAGVLVYGILDIIFCMDFKAFFAHKIQMACTILAALLVGFIFKFDLTGFDTYLPKKENIESMGIYINNFGINSIDVRERIDSMEYDDPDTCHVFLEKMTAKQAWKYDTPQNGSSAAAYVRVTEKSGKTYYRMYRVWESDEEVVTPILLSETYIRKNVLIPDFVMANVKEDVSKGRVQLQGEQQSFDVLVESELQQLYEAYNQDILAKPERYIYQNDKILGHLYVRNGGDKYYYLRLDIYESMEHTVSLIRAFGYDHIFEQPKPEEIASIRFHIYYDKYDGKSLEDYLGLGDKEEDATSDQYAESVINMDPNSISIGASATDTVLYVEQTVDAKAYREYYYEAVFEEPEEIKALVELLTFDMPDYRNVFSDTYCSNVDIGIHYKNGNNGYANMKEGVFPEKYLERFILETYE